MSGSETIHMSVGSGSALVQLAESASCAMRGLEAVAADIAATNIPVLILGESGTGKQVLARHVHEASARRQMPMLQIASGALTADRMPSQLHPNGHAAIGTVVFDEIGDLDRECQRKLLHIMPDGEEGVSKERLSARLISTSCQDLEQEVRAGRFRNDLYHRLNGFCIRIPPLRERREDIPLLFKFFLSKHSARFGKPHADVSPNGMLRLAEHSWPGNLRELENVAVKVLALGNEEIALAGLSIPSVSSEEKNSAGSRRSLKAAARAASRQAERELILKALSRTQWNRKRAAQELEISYKSLLYKLKQIGLPHSESD